MKSRDMDIAGAMSSYVNQSDADYQAFAEIMGNDHRTLQQQFTKLCITWLKHLSEVEYYDDRNKASVEFAKSIKEQLDKVCL